jgi:hypothetical protein
MNLPHRHCIRSPLPAVPLASTFVSASSRLEACHSKGALWCKRGGWLGYAGP